MVRLAVSDAYPADLRREFRVKIQHTPFKIPCLKLHRTKQHRLVLYMARGPKREDLGQIKQTTYHNKVRISVSLSGELDVDLVVGHDLADAHAAAADDHGVDPVADLDLLLDHVLLKARKQSFH